MEKILNDCLECSICFFPMKEDARVLPCSHFFCYDCLTQLANRNKDHHWICPECRQPVDKNVEDLPRNVLLIRLLESLKKPNPTPTASQTVGTSSSSDQQTTELPQTKEEIILVPHAKAAFDFNGTSKEHLSFKKGDKILLRKKIDQQWYFGQIQNRTGVFPIKYVSVVIPLPLPPSPQSKAVALYDFKMGPNEEEGCLAFKKGAIIDVMRRVDLNWAEGRVADKIGIFPLSFVELNSESHKLINESMASGEARAVPANVVPTNLKPSKNTQNQEPCRNIPVRNNQTSPNHQQQQQQQQKTPPPIMLKPNENLVNVVHPEDPRYRDRHIALYPYKPQKEDELELIKGSHYFITEKCQDGWFKGISAENPFKSGVFPGNYVMPFIIYQSFLARRLAAQKSGVNKHSIQAQSIRQHQSGVGYINMAANPNIFNPPELPPRSSAPPLVTPKSTKPDDQNQQKDLKNSDKHRKETVTEMFKKQWSKYNKRSHPAAGSSSEDIVDGSYSMDNPVFEDITTLQQQKAQPQQLQPQNKNLSLGEIKPIHSRSGSCPSQLQQNSLPCDLNNISNSADPRNEEKVVLRHSHQTTSQQRGHHSTSPSNNNNTNKRHSGNFSSPPTSFVGNNNPVPTTSLSSVKENSKVNHRKSQSLDLDSLEVMPKSSNHKAKLLHGASESGKSGASANVPKERFRCVANYPPNSRFELELKIGDIILVHKKRDNGWYKGQNQRTGNIGIFPASFVELDI